MHGCSIDAAFFLFSTGLLLFSLAARSMFFSLPVLKSSTVLPFSIIEIDSDYTTNEEGIQVT